jgi:hypothetical protein
MFPYIKYVKYKRKIKQYGIIKKAQKDYMTDKRLTQRTTAAG